MLSDAHKRAIYDNLGTKGLETEGWEVVQRTKTPQEIREEYERLAREKEERRLLQRTNPTGSITVSVNATELFNQYPEDFNEYGYDWYRLRCSVIIMCSVSFQDPASPMSRSKA